MGSPPASPLRPHRRHWCRGGGLNPAARLGPDPRPPRLLLQPHPSPQERAQDQRPPPLVGRDWLGTGGAPLPPWGTGAAETLGGPPGMRGRGLEQRWLEKVLCDQVGVPRVPGAVSHLTGVVGGHVCPSAAERVTSLGKDWHRPCLKCEKCGKTLTSGGHAEVGGAWREAGAWGRGDRPSRASLCSMKASPIATTPATRPRSAPKVCSAQPPPDPDLHSPWPPLTRPLLLRRLRARWGREPHFQVNPGTPPPIHLTLPSPASPESAVPHPE